MQVCNFLYICICLCVCVCVCIAINLIHTICRHRCMRPLTVLIYFDHNLFVYFALFCFRFIDSLIISAYLLATNINVSIYICMYACVDKVRGCIFCYTYHIVVCLYVCVLCGLI